jgi:signal transduction histidine kinase
MRIILLCILTVCTLFAKAQKQGKQLADSLIESLPNSTNDTVRAKALNRVALFYVSSNIDTALKYAGLGMQLAKKMNWQKGIGAFHTCFGNTYKAKGLYDSSLFHIQQALDISIQLKDSANMAVAYNNLGSTAFSKGDYVNASKYFMLTLKLSEAINNMKLMGNASENIGNVYYYQENYSQSLVYARKSLQLRQTDTRSKELIPNSITLIAMNYKQMKQYNLAVQCFDSALVLYKTNGNKQGEAAVLTNYAEVYAYKKDYYKAIEYSLTAKSVWDELDPNFESALENEGALGSYYLELAKLANSQKIISTTQIPSNKSALLQLAKKYLEPSVQKSKIQNNQSIYSTMLESLAETNALLGDYKNAYVNYRKFNEVQDSIYSQENKNKIAAATSQLEIDKKNAEISLQDITISTQQKQKYFFVAGLLLLSIIGGLLFYQSRTRKKTNNTLMVLNNQLDDANKIKAKFFAILSHDLRSPISNIVNFLHLQKNEPNLFSIEQVAAHDKKLSSSAESLLETMEAMLLWSKGQMENFKPEIKRVAVSDLFTHIKKFFANTENIQFKFNNQQDVFIATDENYLQTIMHNLTSNAIKALKNSTNASIEWSVIQRNNKIELSITDNGPGLQDEQTNILQNDSTTITANSKTGLGLHLVKDLAKSIHCKISVQSQKGIGTTFMLSI